MQTVRVLGACLSGTRAELITVEARFDRRERERTEVVITGLPDPVIRESKGRLVCALEANGFHIPHGRLFLNLVPAALRKVGEALDLPLVLGAGAASGHLVPRRLADALFLGEVGIDGALHAVPGGLAAALAARERGIRALFAPRATAREAAWIPGIEAYGADHLEQVVAHVTGHRQLARQQAGEEPAGDASAPPALGQSLDDVRGQELAKLALAAAAAGGHGLLYIGPPGAGKSMLARRLVALLPPPALEERLEITRVLSAAGRWPGGLVRARPLRAPHHTVSYAGLVGGGQPPAPGEITLAHCGVLFLDELPEFSRSVLEALRQPLEDGHVLISRAGRQLELPARFQLVAAMNPCPCGYRGHPRAVCRCPDVAVQRYRQRISGPLLDRIELRVEVDAPALEELLPRERPAGTASHAGWVAAVGRARSRARARQGPRDNSALDPAELERSAPLDAAARRLLTSADARSPLSARAIQALRRVARTLADLEDEEQVTSAHIARALALRAPL